MLTVKQVKKSFDGVEILKGVDLSVEKGDVVAILGPSGAGKTTLLRCINFLEHADEGELIFDGECIDFAKASKKEIAAIRKKTAFVFQGFNLFANKTALENVTEGLIVARKMPKGTAVEIGKAALDKVGLSDRYDYYPDQLSGGQQQRTAIGRAIVKNPDILLCDEPTGALDYNTSKEILKLIETVNQKYGNTIVMVTHNDAIKDMADRVVKLRDGMIRKNYLNEHKIPAAELDW